MNPYLETQAPYASVDFGGNGFNAQENVAISEEEPRVGEKPALTSQTGVDFLGEPPMQRRSESVEGGVAFRGEVPSAPMEVSPDKLSALEVVLAFALLTVMIVIFVRCTLPGVLFLLGRRSAPSTICIVLGSLWLVNVVLITLNLLV